MVKKIFLRLSGEYDEKFEEDISIDDILSINDAIHEQLVLNKNNITKYHKMKKWDKYKKLTNSYELVFTSSPAYPSISLKNPISRSYFKLWEILQDFKEKLAIIKEPSLKAVFLADAPGGFTEAFINIRQSDHDELVGMSLKPYNRVIPDWKFGKDFCKRNNLTLFNGKKGTGDLYDIENIDSLVQFVGMSKTDFITADGGFDFSSDFNNQEDMSLRLILCEIYVALLIQKENGSFILKIYDIHNICTIKMIYILKLFYEDLHFTKPLSSRPANSEKYIICTGFYKGNEERYKNILCMLRANIMNYRAMFLTNLQVPKLFLIDILRYNRVFILNQCVHIIQTLQLIDNNDEQEERDLVKQQVRKAIKWCHKYNMGISIPSLQKYRDYFLPSSSPTSGLT
jgi:23S rRNA U2552 (ribose-2'-O)-methylase RlmE/FtsJ